MFYDTIFDKYDFVPSKAVGYGFEKSGDSYILRKTLSNEDFYVVLRVSENELCADVFEEPDGEEYLPFNIRGSEGGFVGAIRASVESIVDEVVRECFRISDVKALLIDYVRAKYGTEPAAPWGYLKEYHTLNTAVKKKWYGLFMLIPYRYLGVEKEGKINVLNLKVKPEDIPGIIDNVHYFPSYHMNKKYWISILLDKTADVEFIKKLLDDSYSIVEG